VGDVTLRRHSYCIHDRTLRIYILGVGSMVKCLSCDLEVLDPDSPTVIARARRRRVEPGTDNPEPSRES
jgi:hypothetical protein